MGDAQNDIVDNDDSQGLLLPRYKTQPPGQRSLFHVFIFLLMNMLVLIYSLFV
jgi:hypothetical protein